METFEVTYTWAGTLEVEAEDEDSALEVAAEALKGDHPFNIFDWDDETMEVTA
jgi:hypothetical protein|tara:strand:+ start:799 stop:957 length:159 start_codon:yes stop_codon:yes gene_type:complete